MQRRGPGPGSRRQPRDLSTTGAGSRDDLRALDHTLTTNLTFAFLVCREDLKHLKQASSEAKDKAAIVLVGSTAGKYGEAGNADYAVTMSGMMYGQMMTLENEIVKIAPHGKVNTVAPGWVYTHG